MKEIGHKSSLFPQDYFYKDKWMKVVGKETTSMTNFLHKSSPGERGYFYDQIPSSKLLL